MKKMYFREAIDYTGCQEDVAEALQVNQSILCKVWDNDELDFYFAYVASYESKDTYAYFGQKVTKTREGTYRKLATTDCWKHTEPIPKKQMVTFVKSEVDLLRLFLDKGYAKNSFGTYAAQDTLGFISKMWQYCGKPKPSDWSWESDWLEEKEV